MSVLSKRVRGINTIARINGWKWITHQRDIHMVSFVKDDMRINVYATKMTVATCLNHPTQGRTQLYRKNVTPQELNKIFKNPRVHTNKGYKRK